MQALTPGPEIFHTRARRMTRAEFAKMAELGFFARERVELIHGIVVRMAPIGPPHAEIVDRLTASLVRAVGDAARVRIQQPFVAWDESEPEPDVAVVPARSYASGHPAEAFLVIEVAETSLDYDRKTKAPLYAASAVTEYWIVDVASRCVEVHAHAAEGSYGVVRRAVGDEVLRPTAPALAGVAIGVADLFGE
jgi:Uma2 family endonuclease